MIVRFINDILLSAPSIVVGLFIYEVMVAPMGHFSAMPARWRGGDRDPGRGAHHEDMLRLVPTRCVRPRLDRPAALADDPAHRLSRGARRHRHRHPARHRAGERRDAPLLFTASTTSSSA